MADENLQNLRGLPLYELIGNPFTAVNHAQYNLATTMLDFIGSIGFVKGQGDSYTTRTLDFDLERPVDDGSSQIKSQTVSIKAPLLGLVPIPALLIDHVKVEFSLELKSSTSTKSSVDTKVEAKASYGFGAFKASASGSVSTNRENTRSTDNTAKYNILVEANQQPYTEGMSKIMDLFASATEPINIKNASA